MGFLLLIILGALLLSLPCASAAGRSIGALNGIFTATSAVCVTGLIVVDTGKVFSLFGQVVLLLLIQTGGLGFMAFATMAMAALGRRITLKERLLIQKSYSTGTLSGLVRIICWYGLLAALVELSGAALLSVRFVRMYGWVRGCWYGIWHAVSAFCNAGFDLFGSYESLMPFATDPLVLITLALLVVIGGLGFSVISEALANRLKWRGLSLHARLVLLSTAVLLAAGTVAFLLLEWGNAQTLGRFDAHAVRVLNAFFQSVTMRTAGFNSVDLSAMTDGSKLVSVMLMMIGASSASTGGGMKTTTVVLLLLSAWAVISGRAETAVMGRRIPRDLILRALAVAMVTLLICLGATLALTVTEGGEPAFIDLLFEAASAVATVGVSSAGTSGLSSAGRMILIPVMYIGRVGPLTLAFALAKRRGSRGGGLRFPEERVMIG